MYDLDETIRQRRSVRGFLPDRLVPLATIREALELAQRSPSNCNVQPWRIFLASGAGCDRLRKALVAAIERGDPPQPEDEQDTFPPPYRKLQVECAVALYNEMGIAREDREGRARAMLLNFEFFHAPHVAIVCMEKTFGLGVALDVGTWVQTFMLALWARGVASCPQASLRQYAQIIKPALGIRDELRILCGVSFGYEDPSVPANRTRQSREPLEANVVFINE